jgi:hypothetical protein
MQGAVRGQWLFHWQALQRGRRRALAQPEGPFACGAMYEPTEIASSKLKVAVTIL